MRDSRDNSTAWFVGIILALALIAIGYLVFSAQGDGRPVASSTGLSLGDRAWMAECLKYSSVSACEQRLEYIRSW